MTTTATRPSHTSPRHLSQQTNIFLLTKSASLPAGLRSSLAARVSTTIALPQEQYDALLERAGQMPRPAKDTPPLPDDWQPDEVAAGRRGSKFYGRIPEASVVRALGREEKAGELRLDHDMAWFLSSAEPAAIRGAPACFFNLFKYRGGDKSVHDGYMRGFKERFGKAAGAQVRFMGEVVRREDGAGEEGQEGMRKTWDEANLTRYDSVWHYAYMLSTEVYGELNREKVRGLEDTCILLVSEFAL